MSVFRKVRSEILRPIRDLCKVHSAPPPDIVPGTYSPSPGAPITLPMDSSHYIFLFNNACGPILVSRTDPCARHRAHGPYPLETHSKMFDAV